MRPAQIGDVIDGARIVEIVERSASTVYRFVAGLNSFALETPGMTPASAAELRLALRINRPDAACAVAADVA